MILRHFLVFLALGAGFIGLLSGMKGPSAALMIQERCSTNACALAFHHRAAVRWPQFLQ